MVDCRHGPGRLSAALRRGDTRRFGNARGPDRAMAGLWFDAASSRPGSTNRMRWWSPPSTSAGWPQARNLLAKGVDERGFVFYTNYESRQGGRARVHRQGQLVVQLADRSTGRCVSSAPSPAISRTRRAMPTSLHGRAVARSGPGPHLRVILIPDSRRCSTGRWPTSRPASRTVRSDPPALLGWVPAGAGAVRVLAGSSQPPARSASDTVWRRRQPGSSNVLLLSGTTSQGCSLPIPQS